MFFLSGEGSVELFWRTDQIQVDLDYDLPATEIWEQYPDIKISGDPQGYSKR